MIAPRPEWSSFIWIRRGGGIKKAGTEGGKRRPKY